MGKQKNLPFFQREDLRFSVRKNNPNSRIWKNASGYNTAGNPVLFRINLRVYRNDVGCLDLLLRLQEKEVVLILNPS